MDKIGIRTIVVNFDDEQLPYLSLVQGDAKTRGFDIVICDSDGKEIPPSNDYVVELVATGSNAPDKPYANRHMIKDGKYRVMIPTEALSKSGFVFLQLVFYQKSTGAVIHTIEQRCPVYRSRGQEVVESNNLYVDITALRLGIEKIAVMETAYLQVLEDEATRKSNEIKREENETRRLSSESQILSAEKQRISNEKQRNENESKRVSAEADRTVIFDEMTESLEDYKTPLATDKVAGKVKVDKIPTETGEITVPSTQYFNNILKSRLDDTRVRFGDNSNSSGVRAVAIGYKAQADGNLSVAVGDVSKSEGNRATSVGTSTVAEGVSSVAIGNMSEALYDGSLAIGGVSKAEAISAVAIGYGAISDEPALGVLGVGSSEEGTKKWLVPGDFSVGGTKNFEIPHPNPAKTETHVLRHGAVETNSQGDNLYRYKIEAKKDGDTVTIDLPDYFIYLNKNVQIWATGVDHFGNAYGAYKPEEEAIEITCEKTGEYNILVIGTRNDNHRSVQSWSDKGEVKLKGTSWTFEEDKERFEEMD